MMSALHSKMYADHTTPPEVIGVVHELFQSKFLDAASCALSQELIIKAYAYYGLELNGLEVNWSELVYVNPPGGQVRKWFLKALKEWASGRSREIVFLGFSTSVLRLNQEIRKLDLPFVSPSSRLKFWCPPEQMLWQKIAKLNDKEKAAANHNTLFEALGVGCGWLDEPAGDVLKRLTITGLKLNIDHVVDVQKFVERKKQKSKYRECGLGSLCESSSPPHDNVILFFPDLDNWSESRDRFYTGFSRFGETPLNAEYFRSNAFKLIGGKK